MSENRIPDWIKWGAISLFVVWLCFALGAYYVAQKPLTPDSIQAFQPAGAWSFSLAAVSHSVLNLATAIWIGGVLSGVGLWMWSGLGLPEDDSLERFLLAFGLGMGAVGLTVFFLGISGWLTRPVLWGWLILLTLIAAPKLWQTGLLRTDWRPSYLTKLYLMVTTGLVLTVALLPPTSWDSLSYHLRGPQLFLRAGGIFPGLDLFPVYYPFLQEMLFLLGMAVRNDIVAKLLHFMFLLLLAGLTYLSATRLLKMKEGGTAVLFLYATPLVLVLASIAYNDLAVATVTIGAVYAFSRWQDSQNWRWLVLSGLYCGLAMSFKYNSVITPFLLGLLLVKGYWRNPKTLLRVGLLFAGPAFLLVSFWLVKNWVFTGNPIYPFLFNGRFWDSYRTRAFGGPGTGIGFDPVAILRVPYDITLGIRDASSEGPIGPLYFVLLPFMLAYGSIPSWRQRLPAFGRLILGYSLGHYLFWLLGAVSSSGMWQARFLLPALIMLCPLLAWIVDDMGRWDHPQFSLRRFVYLVLGLVLVFNLVDQVTEWAGQRPLGYVAGNESKEDYWRREMGTLYLASEVINTQLPEDAVVQFLWEPRTYFCQQECRGDISLDRYAHLEYLAGDALGITQQLAADGVTHVLIFERGLAFLQAEQAPWIIPVSIDHYDQFVTGYLRPINQISDAYTLYKLDP